MLDFTPTQRAILRLLSDGRSHSREELHGCLFDRLSDPGAVKKHICLLRKRLRPQGGDVICEIRGGEVYYRRVALMMGGDE